LYGQLKQRYFMDKNSINTGLTLNTGNVRAYGILNPNIFVPIYYSTGWENYEFINTYR